MEFESQVAKIQLGPDSGADSFVYVNAEKLSAGQSESFIVAEILENDPSLQESCQQIASSIQGAVRRAYKKNSGEEAFENALAQANDDLGKLASLGQTHWIKKINCVIGVRTGEKFSITTTGKISTYLLRDGELTDLSCSPLDPHPLKTFENFATGKVKLGDVLVLSTNQLFNHVSIDRIKKILVQPDFLKATGQIIELLKANGGKHVAFGTLLALEAVPGAAPEREINLEEYIEASPSGPSRLTSAWQFFKTLVAPGSKSRTVAYERQGFKNRLKNFGRRFSTMAGKTKSLWNALAVGLAFSKENLKPSQIRQFSPQKKFFFFSILILALALILQISIAVHNKRERAKDEKIVAALTQAKKNLSDADAALLYKDENSAKDFYFKSLAALENISEPSESQAEEIGKIKTQGQSIKARLDKELSAEVESLGTLADSKRLVSLPEYLAAQGGGGQIVSYNRQDLTVRDDLLKLEGKLVFAHSVGNSRAVVYDGTTLKIWNYSSNTVGTPFNFSVPGEGNGAGLAFYNTNSRAYMLDKNKSQVVTFAVVGDSLGRPTVSTSLSLEDGASLVDLAVDGSVYVLTKTDVKKYYAGAPSSFGPLSLVTPLNNPKRVFTASGTENLYVLDAGNRRILIFNKQGNLLYNLASDKFNDLRDFSVDEKNKTIFVLNGSSLLKVNLP